MSLFRDILCRFSSVSFFYLNGIGSGGKKCHSRYHPIRARTRQKQLPLNLHRIYRTNTTAYGVYYGLQPKQWHNRIILGVEIACKKHESNQAITHWKRKKQQKFKQKINCQSFLRLLLLLLLILLLLHERVICSSTRH